MREPKICSITTGSSPKDWREIRNHINRYVEKYDEAVRKAGGKLSLDLLEYKITTNEGDRSLIITAIYSEIISH